MWWQSRAELRFRTAFVQDPCVVEPLIRIVQQLKGLFRIPATIRRTTAELIGESETEQPQSELMLRFSDQDIATDRLCFFRFVEGTVEFRLRDGLGDSACIPWPYPPLLDFRRAANLANKHEQRIIELIHHSLLQRDDGIVGDMDIFRADFRAALSDVTKADAQLVLQHLRSRGTVERMHLQRGGAHEKPWPAKLFLLAVITQDVADVLAKETLNALAKFLYAIHVSLVHLPFDVSSRTKRRNLLIDSEIPGDVSYQILDYREGLHGKDRDGLI